MNSTTVVTFKDEQLRFSRVRTAYSEKEAQVKSLFNDWGVHYTNYELLIRGFKKEKKLQVWARDKDAAKYKLIKTYDYCRLSGSLGPKRKQGDLQVPEGYYHIDRFNPASSFYLSLGINYPNSSDRKKSTHSNLGGDIFVHGNCVSIGCIPITDAKIKELYVMCVEAKSNGQAKIPVHIFPCKMSDSEWTGLKSEYEDQPELISFWENLRPGYLHFETKNAPAKVTISSDGSYQYN
ncbi:MAG: L,D-transpeptidase family protein [Flavobacteriales bacterium]|nr:L,D-transpeptidase family protein [Flavobacteriales bacterium]